MHSAAAQFAAHTVVTGTWLADWTTFWNAGKFNLMSVLMLIFTIIELRKKTDWYHEILLYREGIAVRNETTGEEYFAPKETLSFRQNHADDTVTIRAAAFPHPLTLRFEEGAISAESVLRNNLERYFFT